VHSRFEHGTLPFLDIIALDHALDAHRRLFGSLDSVSRRLASLTRSAVDAMSDLRHANGRPVCLIHRTGRGRYSPAKDDMDYYGPTIAFTLLRSSGDLVGHVELDELAAINNVHIRTGDLCNTGVFSRALGLTDSDIQANYARGRVCWDDEEFGGSDPAGKQPTGIARIGFGALSTHDDVKRWIGFLRRFHVSKQVDMPCPRPGRTILAIPTELSPRHACNM
jgi:molybdenum cofactor sulfurtransferase